MNTIPTPTIAAPKAQRLYFLDWLRVLAFGLLIFYHTGMLYVRWGFHVKSPRLVPWAEWLMVLVNPWRLALLMFISGVASTFLLRKLGAGRFARDRVVRLFPTIAFGMFVVVPPQTYFEVLQRGRYHGDFLSFWTGHYLRADHGLGTPIPTWNHLWFLVYLLAYGLGFAAVASIWGRRRLFEVPVWALVVGPAICLCGANVLASERWPDTHAFANDGAGHLRWISLFSFGALAARSHAFWPFLARHRRRSAAIAFVLGAVFFAVRAAIHAGHVPEAWGGPAYETASGIFGWATILAVVGMARHHLARSSPALVTLNAAILPVYVLHQTVLIVLAMWLFPLGLPLPLEVLVIVVGTFALPFAIYELAIRRVRWVGFWFGVRASRANARPSVGDDVRKCATSSHGTGQWERRP